MPIAIHGVSFHHKGNTALIVQKNVPLTGIYVSENIYLQAIYMLKNAQISYSRLQINVLSQWNELLYNNL